MEIPVQAHPLSQTRSAKRLLSPLHALANLWSERRLISHLVRRDLAARYRGSMGGVLWSLLLPLVMLATYTFVFSYVLKAKFDASAGADESRLEYALLLFSGILVYTVFQDAVGSAPTLILGNVNYVKRVVFPLEVLPFVKVAAAAVHGLIAAAILVVAELAFHQTLSPTVWLFPLVLVPLLMFTLGISWLLASVGVYVRDSSQVVGIVLTLLFFLTPIFYPIDRLPGVFQVIMRFNPLSTFVENARFTLLQGLAPDWINLGLAAVGSLVLMQLGYVWFMKTKRGFADVV